MTANFFSVLIYALFWLARVNGCIRRGRQPLLRGPEWFFNIPVPSNFYAGPGRRILRRYWARMLIPFAIDIPVATAIFVSHRYPLLNWLVVGLAAFIHINHVFSVDIAERQARRFEVAGAEPPVTRLAALVKCRRLRDYTNSALEWTFILVLIGSFGWLVRCYLVRPEPDAFARVFGLPAVLLYLQLGILLVKVLVVRWRSPVPVSAVTEHMEARERLRLFFLWNCDFYRTATVACVVFWTIQISTPSSSLSLLVNIWLAGAILISVPITVWVEIKRKQLAAVILHAPPIRLPDLLQQNKVARWPFCYERSAPLLILKGPRGYSLNLANTFNYVGAAYLTGLVLLVVLLPLGHR